MAIDDTVINQAQMDAAKSFQSASEDLKRVAEQQGKVTFLEEAGLTKKDLLTSLEDTFLKSRIARSAYNQFFALKNQRKEDKAMAKALGMDQKQFKRYKRQVAEEKATTAFEEQRRASLTALVGEEQAERSLAGEKIRAESEQLRQEEITAVQREAREIEDVQERQAFTAEQTEIANAEADNRDFDLQKRIDNTQKESDHIKALNEIADKEKELQASQDIIDGKQLESIELDNQRDDSAGSAGASLDDVVSGLVLIAEEVANSSSIEGSSDAGISPAERDKDAKEQLEFQNKQINILEKIAANISGSGGGGGGSGDGGGGAMDAMGKGIGSLGKGIGKGIEGTLKGLAFGISAFANPKVVLGAAGLAAAIVLIGGAIAGATWMIGKSLPTMAEGMKSFEELDGDVLKKAGDGMVAVALGMAAFGAGSAVSGLGSLVGGITQGITSLFGGDDPLEKLMKFQEYNFDEPRITNNANAMVSYSKGMAALGGAGAVSGIGAAVGALGGAIAGFFGADDPLDNMMKFQEYKFDTARIKSNAEAMAAYAEAMKDFPESPSASVFNAFKGAVVGFLGGDSDPMAPIKRFGEMTLNTENIVKNAGAVKAYAEAMKSITILPPSGDVIGGIEKVVKALGSGNAAGLGAFANAMASINSLDTTQLSLLGGIKIPEIMPQTSAEYEKIFTSLQKTEPSKITKVQDLLEKSTMSATPAVANTANIQPGRSPSANMKMFQANEINSGGGAGQGPATNNVAVNAPQTSSVVNNSNTSNTVPVQNMPTSHSASILRGSLDF